MNSTNFKRPGYTSCSRGHHLHKSAAEARLCEAAWRYAEQQRLRKRRVELGIDELVDGLIRIILK